MWNEAVGWMRDIVEDLRRPGLVRRLDLLSDHLLDDIGIRRDQLDLLRLRPAKVSGKNLGSATGLAVRPSLQGCG